MNFTGFYFILKIFGQLYKTNGHHISRHLKYHLHLRQEHDQTKVGRKCSTSLSWQFIQLLEIIQSSLGSLPFPASSIINFQPND